MYIEKILSFICHSNFNYLFDENLRSDSMKFKIFKLFMLFNPIYMFCGKINSNASSKLSDVTNFITLINKN